MVVDLTKELRQLLTQNARSKALMSSVEIRQVRQAQVIDADYMVKILNLIQEKLLNMMTKIYQNWMNYVVTMNRE